MTHQVFLETVKKHFDKVAVQQDDTAEKVIHEPGTAGLHLFLESCRTDAWMSGVKADAVSIASVQKVFDAKGWAEDISFSKADLLMLVGLLDLSDPDEDASSKDIAHLVDQLDERARAKEFPLFSPASAPWERRADRSRRVVADDYETRCSQSAKLYRIPKGSVFPK